MTPKSGQWKILRETDKLRFVKLSKEIREPKNKLYCEKGFFLSAKGTNSAVFAGLWYGVSSVKIRISRITIINLVVSHLLRCLYY